MEPYFDEFDAIIKKDPEACLSSAQRMLDYIDGSTAVYHGEPVKTLFIPKVFSHEAYLALKEAGAVTYRILEKITQHYLDDPQYRALFPYPEGMEEMVLFERGYETMIPICRLDIFFNEEDYSFKFCEINTDGTSGMVEDTEFIKALAYNHAFTEFKKNHALRSFELYDSFVRVFLKVYEDWNSRRQNAYSEKPYVAIVDFLGDSYISDFYHFKDSFEKAGCACEICEITKLNIVNGRLISPEGHPIDAVYRRAVTTDIFENKNRIPAFLKAVKEQYMCCVGNFCTQVAHNKALFKIIRDPETKAFLNPEEIAFTEAHFPFTGYLNTASTGTDLSIEDVIATKDRWIIKPLDLYGAREILVGSDLTEDAWKKEILRLADSGYLFQEYYYPYRTRNYIPEQVAKDPTSWINMTGLYMYGGELAGFFSRLAPDKVIAGHYGGRTIATLAEEPQN